MTAIVRIVSGALRERVAKHDLHEEISCRLQGQVTRSRFLSKLSKPRISSIWPSAARSVLQQLSRAKEQSAHLISKVSWHIKPQNRGQRQWIAQRGLKKRCVPVSSPGQKRSKRPSLLNFLKLLFSHPHFATSAMVEGMEILELCLGRLDLRGAQPRPHGANWRMRS